MKFIEDEGIVNGRRRYSVECTCGKVFSILAYSYKKKPDRLCNSCTMRINASTHGESHTPVYQSFKRMHNRCYNKHTQQQDYQDRGITVCKEWYKNFPAFKLWALTNGFDETLSLDRENNDEGYSPSNCRFVAVKTQNRNTKLLRKNNTSGYRGVVKNRDKWSARIQIDGKVTSLGSYTTKLEAAKAYDTYVLKHKLEHTINGV